MLDYFDQMVVMLLLVICLLQYLISLHEEFLLYEEKLKLEDEF